jgi:hypothetical protein
MAGGCFGCLVHRGCFGRTAVGIGHRWNSPSSQPESVLHHAYDKPQAKQSVLLNIDEVAAGFRATIYGERTPMTRNRIVCFRLDGQIDHRIARVLGSRYSTRSRFIRNAIEKLLLQEENQVRLRAAHTMIRWD